MEIEIDNTQSFIEYNTLTEEKVDYINENEINSVKKMRKKRRTKNELEGRNHKCELCPNAYLSVPALTNHIKSKHSNTDSYMKQSKARSKKDSINNFLLEYQEKIRTFFKSKQSRISSDDNELNNKKDIIETNHLLLKISKSVYDDVYVTNKKLNSTISNFESHSLLKMIFISEETETDSNSQQKHKTIDESLSDFIKSSLNQTNTIYLEQIIKFCCILHECINKFNNDKNYTQKSSSEAIPEYSNELVKFVVDSNIFGDDQDTKLDMIDWIQYLCLWLLDNKYTSIKINLNLK